jgi:hypothetical protein
VYSCEGHRSLFIITVADTFDPTPLLSRFAERFEDRGENKWAASFTTDLHGLAVLEHSDSSEIRSFRSDLHPVDRDGWADWQQAAPGEHEMTDPLLPAVDKSPGDRLAWRYEDIYWWDPEADPIDQALARNLGLSGAVEEPRALAAGRGDFVWKVAKFGWKAVGVYTRVTNIYMLADRAGLLRPLQQSMVRHRAEMAQREQWRRQSLALAEVRRERLERGSPSSRQKARQYYTTLDALIAANS